MKIEINTALITYLLVRAYRKRHGLVQGIGTPANNGTLLTIENGLLNFTTGGATDADNSDGTLAFGPGGTFTPTGTVKNGNTVISTGDIIYNGTFTGESTVTGFGIGGLFAGVGTDLKNASLLEFFDLADLPFTFANTDISFTQNCVGFGSTENNPVTYVPGGGFDCRVSNADITNTAVPIPAAAWLFGSAMIGLAGVARKRKAA